MQLPPRFVTSLLLVLFGFTFILSATLPTVEIGKWSSGPDLPRPLANASAVLLSDGSLFICGGSSVDGPVAAAQIFSGGAFGSAGSMSIARANHASVVLKDGRVLVTGGTTGSGATNQAELFDPADGSWSAAGNLLDARSGHTASLLHDGRVLIAGGFGSAGPISSLEIYDPDTNNFSAAGALASARTDHAAVVLSNGHVLIIGGSDGSQALASTENFNPGDGSVSAGPTLSTPRAKASATTLLDGRIAVIGGNNGSAELASAEIYSSGSFSPASGNLVQPRSGHLAFLLPHNNSVLIVGGSAANNDLASAELFAPWSGNFSATGSLASPRNGSVGGPLDTDGLLVVAGGTNSAGSELYGFATVKTDKDDYAPGQTVQITGSGWQPGEAVTLSFVESPNIDTHPSITTTADANGTISDGSLSPDIHDLNVRFYLTAAGSVSSAQTTFTDAAGDDTATTIACTPNPVTQNSATTCTATVNNTASPVTNGFPQGTVLFQFTGTGTAGTFTSNPCTLSRIGTTNNSSCSVTLTPTTAVSGKVKANYNALDNRWKNSVSANLDLTVNAPTCTPPAVTTNPSSTTAAAGQNVSFVAAASGTPTPTVQWQVSTNGGTTFTNLSGATSATLTLNSVTASMSGNQYRAVFTNTCTPPTATTTAATLTVNKSTPVITWSNPADITYGTALSGTQLNATATFNGNPVAGTFTYTPAAGTKLSAGNGQTLSVDFAPTDTATYNSVNNTTVHINVLKAPLTVTANDANRLYGDPNPAFSVNYSGFVNGETLATSGVTGTPSVTTTATAISSVPGSPYLITTTLGSLAAANYSFVFVNGNLTINPAALSVTPANATREYGDANPAFTGTITGIKNSDNLTASYASAATAASSVAGSPYDITATVNDPDHKLPNYNLTSNIGHLTISPAPLTVTPANATREYGDANPSFTGTITGIKNSDNLTATYASVATAASSVAGSPYDITATVNDPDHKLPNYNLTSNVGHLTISPAPLTVTPANASRLYGAANPAFTGSITGIKNSDNITATYYSAAMPGSSVAGSPYDITATLVDPDHKLVNYTTTSNVGHLTISPAPLSVKADDKSRTYGAANPAFTGVLTGVVNSDNITATYSTLAVAGSNVGTYAITPALADPDHRLGNYDVTSTDGTLVIIKAALSVKADDKSRTYGAANPAFTGVLTGVVNSDNITATYSTLAVAGSNVGTYAITPALADPDHRLGNYDVTSTDGTLVIIKAALSVKADDKSRTYGAANPALTGVLTGVVNSDNITATYSTLAVAGSNVGTYAITPALADPDHRLGNYDLTSTDGTLVIIKAALSVKADDKSRTYGAANPALTGVLTGVVNSDNITATYSTLAVQGSNVGSYAITPALSDPDSRLANYDVSSTDGTLLISKAGLAVKADDKSRSYGAANPALTGELTGVVNSDNITASYSTPAVVGSNIGSYPITPALADPDHRLGNYDVTSTDGTLLISKVALSVAADDKSRLYGAANPALTGVLTGVVNSDNITATYSTPATAATNIGNYAITPALADPDHRLGNYNVTSTNGTLTIGKASLSVTADDKSRNYGAANPALTGVLTGVVNSDNITASYSTAAVAGSNIGSYPITPALADPDHRLSNYDVTSTDGTLLISKAALSVSADAKSRTYGAANPAFTGVLSGVVNGDNITATYASAATPSSNVGTYPITPTLLDPNSRLGNYAVTSTNGVLTINTALLTITADNKSKIYNAGNPALTATYAGFVLSQTPADLAGTLSCSTAAVLNSLVGSYPINCSGQTSTNYAITYVAGALKILYSTLACAGSAGHTILQPINPDGTSVFKQGSTTPAKFRVCDANGVSIGTAGVVSSFKIVAIQAGLVTQTVNEDPISTTPDDAFRWDPTDKQWIYNIKTKNLFANDTYTFAITLNDGSTIPFMYGLK